MLQPLLFIGVFIYFGFVELHCKRMKYWEKDLGFLTSVQIEIQMWNSSNTFLTSIGTPDGSRTLTGTHKVWRLQLCANLLWKEREFGHGTFSAKCFALIRVVRVFGGKTSGHIKKTVVQQKISLFLFTALEGERTWSLHTLQRGNASAKSNVRKCCF